MKKLIFAAIAAVAMVGAANAALAITVRYTAFYAPESAKLVEIGGGEVQWQGTFSTYTGDATLYCEEVADWSQTFTFTKGNSNSSTSYTLGDGFSAGGTYTFYFEAIVKLSNEEFKYKSNTTKVKNLGSASYVGGGSQGSSKGFSFNEDAVGYWVAVPEPTSGMLLLLGVAGLALKRKRA